MPTADDALRALMIKWFGGIDDSPPYKFLQWRGWTEQGGYLSKPSPTYQPSVYELACLKFLRDEWDYDFPRDLYQRIEDL